MPFGRGDGGMRISVVALQAEVADILHYIEFQAVVFGITEILGHVVAGVGLPLIYLKACLDRVFEIFIEHAKEDLLVLRREPLPP